MEKLKTVKYLWLTAATASLGLGAVAICGAVIFSLKIMYVPLLISLVLAANAFYGTPFYFIAYKNMRLTERAAQAMADKGLSESAEIAEYINISPDFCEKLIEKAKKKNYIPEASGENK